MVMFTHHTKKAKQNEIISTNANRSVYGFKTIWKKSPLDIVWTETQYPCAHCESSLVFSSFLENLISPQNMRALFLKKKSCLKVNAYKAIQVVLVLQWQLGLELPFDGVIKHDVMWPCCLATAVLAVPSEPTYWICEGKRLFWWFRALGFPGA